MWVEVGAGGKGESEAESERSQRMGEKTGERHC